MMKAPLRADPHRGEKRRTALLVMTPYGIGLLPMITLIPSLRLLYAIIAVSVMEVILMIITSVWDILLLVTFWRRRRILKQIDMENVITVSTLIKLLAFCLYRLILTPVISWRRNPLYPSVLSLKAFILFLHLDYSV
ncbi:hypothetical protein K439DRAFT_937538 [Ramaria rubella]|nr:hypothetical protein K439DRAFT_937538 [Ramaria rubella]